MAGRRVVEPAPMSLIVLLRFPACNRPQIWLPFHGSLLHGFSSCWSLPSAVGIAAAGGDFPLDISPLSLVPFFTLIFCLVVVRISLVLTMHYGQRPMADSNPIHLASSSHQCPFFLSQNTIKGVGFYPTPKRSKSFLPFHGPPHLTHAVMMPARKSVKVFALGQDRTGDLRMAHRGRVVILNTWWCGDRGMRPAL